MRHASLVAVLAAAALLAVAAPVRADLTLPRISPNATVSQTIGTTTLSFAYSRPGVKGRPIWGALVPYGRPWRTGANDATTFTTTDPITIAGQSLPAGTYSFFTIPAPGTWTVIFSKQKDLWGSFAYDSTQDQLRVTATADTTQPNQEWMALGFDGLTPTSCDMVIRWEKLRLAVPVTVDVNAKVLGDCRREVANLKPDDWRTAYRAASWAYDANVATTDADGWLERSLSIQQNYQNLGLKARRQALAGDYAGAIATGQKGVEAGKASKDKVDTSSLEKSIAEWQAKAPSAAKGKTKKK
jgi:hypothetical protein